jgi:hypothetical protein
VVELFGYRLEDLPTISQWLAKVAVIGTLAGGIAHDFNNILAATMVLPLTSSGQWIVLPACGMRQTGYYLNRYDKTPHGRKTGIHRIPE